jgi:hypothetical protein
MSSLVHRPDPARLAPCKSDQLHAGAGFFQALTGGTFSGGVVFHNTSTRPCRLSGTPRVTFLDANDETLPNDNVPIDGWFFPHQVVALAGVNRPRAATALLPISVSLLSDHGEICHRQLVRPKWIEIILSDGGHFRVRFNDRPLAYCRGRSRVGSFDAPD